MWKVLSRPLLFIIPAALMCGALSLFAPVMAQGGPPLKLEIEPIRQIYSNHEGVTIKVSLTALTRTKLCLEKDILSQMQFNISRSGKGKLALQPLVIRDDSQMYRDRMRVRWLESGQNLVLRANIKRFQFAEGEQWVPGEYSLNATFNLCEQNSNEDVTDPGQEIPIHAARQAWFMIMI